MRLIDRRDTPRFHVQFRTTLTGAEGQEGLGILHDLSLVGCGLDSSAPVQCGLLLELRIHVPGLGWPLMIETAQVQWVRGHMIGLAFLHVKKGEQDRLEQVIAELQEECGLEEHDMHMPERA